MIARELESLTTTDRRRRAGHDAEAQLAFYLKRAFGYVSGVHVLNNLRLETHDDAAQLDHLIVHPYGMVVVESKSVFGEIKVSTQGEWSRSYRGRYQGMPSAKLQAERQVLFLRRYLQTHSPRLVKGATPAEMPLDVLVAVSDSAVIHRPKNVELGYLVKAEKVPERVTQLIEARKPKSGLFGFHKRGFSLSESELTGLTTFLNSHHTPLTFDAALETSVEPDSPAGPIATPITGQNEYRCKYCESERLEVRWGHSYYFRCLDCDKNTAISRRCGGCGDKERVRKEGPTFYGECAPCGRSAAFFVNAS